MASDEWWLPLFPLNTVLFPNASVPLQIFEERYKLMMQHCLDNDSKFGAVLIKAGSEVGEPAIPYSTGTVAHIVQVNRLKAERLLIAVSGQQRFQIKSITQYRPFIGAQVTLLEDDSDTWVPPTEMEAIRQAVTGYFRMALGLRGGWTREVTTPSEPVALSYFIADTLQVGVQEKQALLEEPDASKRLEAELDLLRQETETLRRRVTQEMRKKFSRH